MTMMTTISPELFDTTNTTSITSTPEFLDISNVTSSHDLPSGNSTLEELDERINYHDYRETTRLIQVWFFVLQMANYVGFGKEYPNEQDFFCAFVTENVK